MHDTAVSWWSRARLNFLSAPAWCSVTRPQQVCCAQAHAPSRYGILHQPFEAGVASLQESGAPVQLLRFFQHQLFLLGSIHRQSQGNLLLRRRQGSHQDTSPSKPFAKGPPLTRLTRLSISFISTPPAACQCARRPVKSNTGIELQWLDQPWFYSSIPSTKSPCVLTDHHH